MQFAYFLIKTHYVPIVYVAVKIKVMVTTWLSPRGRLATRLSFFFSQLRGRIAQSSRCGQKTFLMANLKINFACPYRWNARNGSRTFALLRLFQEEEEFS